MKREKSNHYSRIKEEDEEEIVVPDFKTALVPSVDFKPIEIESQTEHKPIKIVNQTQQKSEAHVPLKEALRNSLSSKISPLLNQKKRSPNSQSGAASDNDTTSDSSFTFSTPITVTNSALSLSTGGDSSEFSFGTPNKITECVRNKRRSVEEVLRSVREAEKKEDEVEEDDDKVEIASKEPPGEILLFICECASSVPFFLVVIFIQSPNKIRCQALNIF